MLQLIRGLIEQHSLNKGYICKKKPNQKPDVKCQYHRYGNFSLSVFCTEALCTSVPQNIYNMRTTAQQAYSRLAIDVPIFDRIFLI